MKLGDSKDVDNRHTLIKAMLDLYWLRENQTIPSLPWGAADAGALGQFLRANPNLKPNVVEECLFHRLCSEDHAPAERVHRWIGDVLRYASGPLNRFSSPCSLSKPRLLPAPIIPAKSGASPRRRKPRASSWEKNGSSAP